MVASTQKKKIGIYSGSFNPIHIGHLALANWLCEYTDMDEIWFLVTPQNPFKKNMDLMEDNMRLELVRRAVEDYPKFKVSDFEFSLPKPSYTIHTLRALSKNYPDYDFLLIMGADNWVKFHHWQNHEDILNESEVIVYPRKGYKVEDSCVDSSRMHYVNAPEIEISSTFIRESIQQRKDIRFFLPEKIRPILLPTFVLLGPFLQTIL